MFTNVYILSFHVVPKLDNPKASLTREGHRRDKHSEREGERLGLCPTTNRFSWRHPSSFVNWIVYVKITVLCETIYIHTGLDVILGRQSIQSLNRRFIHSLTSLNAFASLSLNRSYAFTHLQETKSKVTGVKSLLILKSCMQPS